MESGDISSAEIVELAQSVNLSASRLRALFKTETGLTPAQYFKRLKLQRAKELASTTHLTIGQILESLEVGDESHFLREFKKVYCVTLNTYRKGEN